MYELIHFMPVEIMSSVCFFCGIRKRSDMDIVSILLVPYDKSGKVVVTESPFPEIFLQ